MAYVFPLPLYINACPVLIKTSYSHAGASQIVSRLCFPSFTTSPAHCLTTQLAPSLPSEIPVFRLLTPCRSVLTAPPLPPQALQGLAADMKGRVICPRTQEVYPDSQLEKVFVM